MLLDFEKPIADLEQKIRDMKRESTEKNIDISAPLAQLEATLKQLKIDTFKKLTRWQRVQLSRHADRPYTLDYIELITKDFIELHGDRNVRDDPAMVGGICQIDGQSVMLIGQQKGRNTKQRQQRNFGMANPEGYRKALRLMKLAEKFDIPVLTLIDTPGAFPGLEAEERGQGEAIARNLKEMAVLEVPIVCVIIGEGASGGALGIGVGDKVYMLENTWYSVISPESCSSILWRSWDYKEQAAEALKLTATDMFKLGMIDGIIEEPIGGAHTDYAQTAVQIKEAILKDFSELLKLPKEVLIAKRIEKFASMGVYNA
jgi:acetyl-CoA carboxylase carboxyl transferase subunit alpha